MTWKYKWIKVIRECRNQAAWLPSPFSVVCSVHFAEGDIYTTPGGNRRITKQAAPTLKLYDVTPRRRKGDLNSTIENVSVSVQTNTGQSSDGMSDSNMGTDDQESSGYSGEQIQKVIIKVESKEDVETGEIETQTDALDETLIIKEEPKEEFDIEISIDPLAQQNNAGNRANAVPDSSYYEKELKAKDAQLEESKKKINMLQEKMRRLQNRNLKMKNILKEIKVRKLIDRDVFKQLTAGLIEKDN